MKTIKATNNEVWSLFYEWCDNSPVWYGAYTSKEALLFDFDHAYKDITYGRASDEITDEEIARAREELKNASCTDSEDFDLYMYIEHMHLFELKEEV